MNNDELQAIRARVEAATPGPWVTDNKNRYVFTLPNDGQKMIAEMHISGGQMSNSEQEAHTVFCAHARQDISSLLAHIDHQQRALEWLATENASVCCVPDTGCPFSDHGCPESTNCLETKAEDWIRKAFNATEDVPSE